MTRTTLALGAALLLAAFTASCGDEEECVGDCECRGADCICPASGDCAVSCVADCDIQCAGSGNCDFECGAGCLAECTSSGECEVDVGAGSRVECTASGNCDIACHGDCTVRCSGSGDCILRCDLGASCNMESCSGEVTECADGITQICGRTGCPA